MLQGYTESVHIRASSGVRSKMKRHQVSGKPQSDVRRQIKQPQEKRDFKIRMVKEIWCMDGRCTAGEVLGKSDYPQDISANSLRPMELHDRAQRKIQIGVSMKNKHECPQIDHSTKGLIRRVENNYLLLKKHKKLGLGHSGSL